MYTGYYQVTCLSKFRDRPWSIAPSTTPSHHFSYLSQMRVFQLPTEDLLLYPFISCSAIRDSVVLDHDILLYPPLNLDFHHRPFGRTFFAVGVTLDFSLILVAQLLPSIRRLTPTSSPFPNILYPYLLLSPRTNVSPRTRAHSSPSTRILITFSVTTPNSFPLRISPKIRSYT